MISAPSPIRWEMGDNLGRYLSYRFCLMSWVPFSTVQTATVMCEPCTLGYSRSNNDMQLDNHRMQDQGDSDRVNVETEGREKSLLERKSPAPFPPPHRLEIVDSPAFQKISPRCATSEGATYRYPGSAIRPD